MSIAAEEPRNELSQTTKKADVDDPDKAENKSINHFATFPWLYGILRKCREAIGTKQTNTLENLLYALVKELTVSIKDCYSRPNRAGKLRDIICQMLVYFHLMYLDLKAEYIDNNGTYLHLMTELLSMYLDLEIKASKRGVHSLKKVGQFMAMALYTHLGESEDHIVEAILKAKLITKSTGELCAPVLLKVLNDGKCFVVDENSYVRFLLAFKLLQRITRKTDRFDVTKMAMNKLKPTPRMVKLVRRMTNIFPPQKDKSESMTVFLMNANFDFIKAKLEFLKTRSISNDSMVNLYPDKPFTYGNRSNTKINLLKNYREDGRRNVSIYDAWSYDKNKIDSLIDFEHELSMDRLSLWSKDDDITIKKSDMDSCELKVFGTEIKEDKPKLRPEVITLDSDEEINEKGKNDLQTTSESKNDDCLPANDKEKNFEKEPTEQKNKKDHCTVSEKDSSDIKCEPNKEKILTKITNVPEKEENPNSDCKGKNLSTKHSGGLLSSKSQGSNHGVIDSTNNFSRSGESVRSSMPKTCLVQDKKVVDENRTEVSSTLDTVNAATGTRDKYCQKAQEVDITMREKSEVFTATKSDQTNVKKDLNGALSLNSHDKNLNAVSDRPYGILRNNISKTVKNSSRSVTTSAPLVQSTVDIHKNCIVITTSNPELNNKNEKCNNIQNNLSIVKSQVERLQKASKTDAVTVPKTVVPVAKAVVPVVKTSMTTAKTEINSSTGKSKYLPRLIRRSNQNKTKLNIMKPKESSQTEFVGKTLTAATPQTVGTKRPANEPLNQPSKEVKMSQIGKGEIGSKNFTLASGNLNKLISSSAKKVNFENVMKSYKIVKSNRLKAPEPSLSSNGQNKEMPFKSDFVIPKIIKLGKSSFFENNVKVNEKVKNVNKTLDFRTANVDCDLNILNKKGKEKCESTKPIDDKSVKTRSRTSQCVPIIFKKIEETNRENSEREDNKPEKDESDKMSPKPRETKRKHKVNSPIIIKTDMEMQSILKTINPSTIPQFAEDMPKNSKKRRCTEVEQTASKIKCVDNNSVDKHSVDNQSVDNHSEDKNSVVNQSVDNHSSGDSSENRTVEIKLVIPEKYLDLRNIDKLQVRGKETPCIPLIYPSIVHFPLNIEQILNTAFPQGEESQANNKKFPSFYVNKLPAQSEKLDKESKTQDNTSDSSDTFFISANVEAPTLESGKPSTIPFEQVYQEILLPQNCNVMKNDENGKPSDVMRNDENGKSSDDMRNDENVKPPDVMKNDENRKSPDGVRNDENGKPSDGIKNGRDGMEEDVVKTGEDILSSNSTNKQMKKQEDSLRHEQSGKSEVGMIYEEYGKSDFGNEKEITDIVQQEEVMNIIDDKRCESHGRTSSMEVGMELSGQLCSTGKFPMNASRDLAINEISPVDLKFVDDEFGKYDDPWDDPKDCCPEDDEFFLRSLPDPQKLFCEEDYKHLLDDAFHSVPNINIDTIRPEDFADLDLFSKSIGDPCEEYDINNLESTCNENSFFLNGKFPGFEVSHIIEVQPNQYEPSEKSASLSPPEYRGDDKSKLCFEKGRRSRSNSSSSNSSIKSRKRSYTGNRNKSEPGEIKEGIWQSSYINLRSDSVPYHTRSISQKGIPVEYTLPEPKKVPGKRNRPS